MSELRLAISAIVPMYFTSRFENHNGRHWWVAWIQWREKLLWSTGHRQACCRTGEHLLP